MALWKKQVGPSNCCSNFMLTGIMVVRAQESCWPEFVSNRIAKRAHGGCLGKSLYVVERTISWLKGPTHLPYPLRPTAGNPLGLEYLGFYLSSMERFMSTLLHNWPHRWFYFKMTSHDMNNLPLFEEMVDESWRPGDLPQIVQYLITAPILLCSDTDPLECPRCGQVIINSSVWRWDNNWLWSETITHPVEKHCIRPPDKMVENIKRRNYIPPLEAECNDDQGLIVLKEMQDFFDCY